MTNKKTYTLLAIIIVMLVAATGYFLWTVYYDNIDAADVPVTPIKVAGQDVLPMSADVTVPVLGGMFSKQLDCLLGNNNKWWVVPEGTVFDMQDPAAFLGLLGDAPYNLTIELPDGMGWNVALTYGNDSGTDAPVYVYDASAAGPAGALSEEILLKRADEYVLEIEGRVNEETQGEYTGSFYYRVYFSVKIPDPVFTSGRTELAQGDILSLKLENMPYGITPEIESQLGPAIFTNGVPLGEGEEEEPVAEGLTNWYAAIPISNSRAPGEYYVLVQAGEFEYETIVTVSEYEFAFQNMIIDTSVPSVAAAMTNAAYEEFREKVSSLFPLLSEERYWNGVFIMPVDLGPDDFISTEFGEIRITNGNQSTRRSHVGVDFAVPPEAPVYACGRGKVLVAEFLLNTGNTVVIDHGGGLKSFHYHLNSVATEAGAIIEQGDLVGRVGSTGYSTGPHLHFEMRIGEQPVSPSMLFEPDAGLYSAE